MLEIAKITPTIGAELTGVEFAVPMPASLQEEIYQALMDNLVIFLRGASISPAEHLAFAQGFGELDEPHHSLSACRWL